MLTPSTRRECQRYRYDDASRAGFVELSDDSVGPDQLRSLLLQVPRVCEVVPHRAGSKAAQGNASSGHAQQHNWQVMSVDLQLRADPVVVEAGERPYECLEIQTPLHEFEAFATARLEALARLGEADRAEIAKGALELGRIALRQAMGGAKETL